MSKTWKGWAFVAMQAMLLGALILLPRRNHWPTPDWLELVGRLLVLTGFAIMAPAALRLGRSLTPTPVPVGYGQLTTTGLYRFVRHPIYTGVLAVAAGLTVASGSWWHLAVALGTLAFFHRKAAWEEDRWAETYPGYRAYAAATPRFFPRPRIGR